MEGNLYALLPKVDLLLEDPSLKKLEEKYEREDILKATRKVLDSLRENIKEGIDKETFKGKLTKIDSLIEDEIRYEDNKNLKRVINATGTIIHTNLGRSKIPGEIYDKVRGAVTGYSNLEYNINKGERGSRYDLLENLVCEITGGEAALVVNNNAAAVMLVLNTFGKGYESIVSRGELIEIGGSFRIPDVMEASGSHLIEVGTTNKTHLRDYKNAINENTRLILKVHTSNYKILGFTEGVSSKDLSQLKSEDIILYEDVGSGVLIDLAKYGLEEEPTVGACIKNGVDLVSFSGDKLLGGVQAGIIVGRKELIDQIKVNPLTRAFRVDKLTISILYELFKLYRNEEEAIKKIPSLRMILEGKDSVRERAELLRDRITDETVFDSQLIEIKSQVGGGSLPLLELDSYGITIGRDSLRAHDIERFLRLGDIPIITRLYKDELTLDLRTIDIDEIDIIIERLKEF